MYTYLPTPSYDEYLEHFGIPGMKWGHRKQPIRTGTGRGRKFGSLDARRKVTSSRFSGQAVQKPKKVKKKHKGYSEKTYKKFKQQGMTHAQAVDAAKKSRRKKIAGLAVGAAAIGLTALAVKSKYNTPRRGETQIQMYERRAREKRIKEDKKAANFKFSNQKHYQAVKNQVMNDKLAKAQRENPIKVLDGIVGSTRIYKNVPGHVDPNSIKITEDEVRRAGYRQKQLRKAAKKARFSM